MEQKQNQVWVEKFSCKRGGQTVRGLQVLPEGFEGSRKYRAIIFSHGFRGSYLDMEGICRKFAGFGYAAFCFSFCGGGQQSDGEEIQSDGNSLDMCIESEVSDLLAVKDYVKGLDYVDGQEIVLAGVSQGGFVSGVAAARCGKEIKKLVMICPALCIPDHARRGRLGGAVYDIHQVPERIDCGNTVLGRGFHEEAAGMDAFLQLSPYQGPVLLIHGLEDGVVDYSYAVRAKENYRKGQCHLQLIRNAGHGFSGGHWECIGESMRQFLEGHKEVLTIRIIVTDSEAKEEGEERTIRIYFTGYCECDSFQGTVLPGGCDTRVQRKGEPESVRAEYTLLGRDRDGVKCYLHIVNRLCGEEYKPLIHTNSPALSWMNDAEFTAVVEGGDGGPTVRIFAGQ